MRIRFLVLSIIAFALFIVPSVSAEVLFATREPNQFDKYDDLEDWKFGEVKAVWDKHNINVSAEVWQGSNQLLNKEFSPLQKKRITIYEDACVERGLVEVLHIDPVGKNTSTTFVNQCIRRGRVRIYKEQVTQSIVYYDALNNPIGMLNVSPT